MTRASGRGRLSHGPRAGRSPCQLWPLRQPCLRHIPGSGPQQLHHLPHCLLPHQITSHRISAISAAIRTCVLRAPCATALSVLHVLRMHRVPPEHRPSLPSLPSAQSQVRFCLSAVPSVHPACDPDSSLASAASPVVLPLLFMSQIASSRTIIVQHGRGAPDHQAASPTSASPPHHWPPCRCVAPSSDIAPRPLTGQGLPL